MAIKWLPVIDCLACFYQIDAINSKSTARAPSRELHKNNV